MEMQTLPSVAQMQTFASQLKNINVMETLGKLQEFSNSVHDAYAGAQTLTSKNGQLTSGANQLAGGLGPTKCSSTNIDRWDRPTCFWYESTCS